MYTKKIMTDISLFSVLIKGPEGDEETIEELSSQSNHNIIVIKIYETQRTQWTIYNNNWDAMQN